MDAHPGPWGQTMLCAAIGVDLQCKSNRCPFIISETFKKNVEPTRIAGAAARDPGAGPSRRGAVGSKIEFFRKGGVGRWMAHEHGELGIGPGEPGTPAGVSIASPGTSGLW